MSIFQIESGFSIFRDPNHDLHRKGPKDLARHNEKVKEAIKNNLGDVISDEAIITSDGNNIVKIPIRNLDLPRFRFDDGKSEHVGQGSGKSNVGDVVGQKPGDIASGKGRGAGEEPGIDYYEAEITIDELGKMIFEDLDLPNLEQKQNGEITRPKLVFKNIGKKGLFGNLHKKRTILENIKRNAMTHRESGYKPKFQNLREEDMRFITWEEEEQRETNAAVIAMRDVSGSMGEFEKYISRSFYFWMVRFLRSKYNNVQIAFITHHTEAKEATEEEFFTKGESGGTKVSSAYQLAREMIKERFHSDSWNIYPFHFSDGDNWGDEDNRICVDLVRKMIDEDKVNMFGYGEIQQIPHGYTTLRTAFKRSKLEEDPKFVPLTITSKRGVYPALKKFFEIKEAA